MAQEKIERVDPPRSVPEMVSRSRSLWILVYGSGGAVLYFAHAAFIPIALALLFALVLSGPVEMLHRHRLPRSVSAILILMIFLGVMAGATNLLWEPAQEWVAAAPRTVKLVEQKVQPAARILHRIEAVADRAGHLGDGGASATGSSAKAMIAPATSDGFVFETRTVLVAMTTVVILTLFLLAGGPPMLARMTASPASDARSAHVLHVIDAVRGEVGRYYAMLALINLGLGLVTGLTMMALGMPDPILWGAIAGVLNFIPYAGSTATLIVLTVVAFVSFHGLGRVVAVSATYLCLAAIEGQIVQPLLVGRRLELNPIIVFLALWLGWWFWGIAGVVTAVPSLVALKVVAEHRELGAPLVEFLSPSRAKRFKLRHGQTDRLARVNKVSTAVRS